jgi:hypothetical protein
MKYQKIIPRWEDEEELNKKIELFKEELAINLTAVHNKMSSSVITLKDAFYYEKFEQVDPQYEESFEPFKKLNWAYNVACQGIYKGADEQALNAVISDFIEIRDNLEKEMAKLAIDKNEES